jgi:HD-like signal output (HDOD) protein
VKPDTLYPLSNDNQHQTTAIAKSDVSVIHFSKDVLLQSNINTHNPLAYHKDIPENLQENKFFKKFCIHYQQNKLVIPSLPNVALKLRSAMQQDIGTQEAVSIVNMDSVISSKLIQIVNSPFYQAATPITNCQDAITRLGLTTTRNIVTSISMENLFKSNNTKLNKKILFLWKQSIHISSISQTLATLTKKTNPDEALLAGLIHNIGALPIIIFADTLDNDEYTDEDIVHTISAVQGILGDFILEKWGVPEPLKHIPRQSENWYFCSDEKKEITLSDIVILAKYHSHMGSSHATHLPSLHTLPAFQKLGDNTLTADMSLQVLHDAKKQIADSMNLF